MTEHGAFPMEVNVSSNLYSEEKHSRTVYTQSSLGVIYELRIVCEYPAEQTREEHYRQAEQDGIDHADFKEKYKCLLYTACIPGAVIIACDRLGTLAYTLHGQHSIATLRRD